MKPTKPKKTPKRTTTKIKSFDKAGQIPVRDNLSSVFVDSLVYGTGVWKPKPEWQRGQKFERPKDVEVLNWPDCLVPGCANKSCRKLESELCHPHTREAILSFAVGRLKK